MSREIASIIEELNFIADGSADPLAANDFIFEGVVPLDTTETVWNRAYIEWSVTGKGVKGTPIILNYLFGLDTQDIGLLREGASKSIIYLTGEDQPHIATTEIFPVSSDYLYTWITLPQPIYNELAISINLTKVS